MKRKSKKKRTQNKFENNIVASIRKSFAMYSPKYEEVLSAGRIEKVKYKIDYLTKKRFLVHVVKKFQYGCHMDKIFLFVLLRRRCLRCFLMYSNAGDNTFLLPTDLEEIQG